MNVSSFSTILFLSIVFIIIAAIVGAIVLLLIIIGVALSMVYLYARIKKGTIIAIQCAWSKNNLFPNCMIIR